MEELVLNVTSVLVFCAFIYIVHMTAQIWIEECEQEELRHKRAMMKWKRKNRRVYRR